MHFQDVARRVTGLSCPIFGISWQPSEPEIDTARRIVRFLEDRRVLFVRADMELPDYCVRSVLEIRRFLTTELGGLGDNQLLGQQLQAMRAACRKFLQALEGPRIVGYQGGHGGEVDWAFERALGELRGVFGIHIAQIAAAHGLDVEPDLASILPAEDVSDGDGEEHWPDLERRHGHWVERGGPPR